MMNMRQKRRCSVLRCEQPATSFDEVQEPGTLRGVALLCSGHLIAKRDGGRWIYDRQESVMYMDRDLPPLLQNFTISNVTSSLRGSLAVTFECENPDGSSRDIEMQIPNEKVQELREVLGLAPNGQ